MGMTRHHEFRRDVEGLTVEIGIVLDYGKDERVVGHHNLNIIRLSGDSLEVSDGEVDSPSSLISYEPDQDNVCPVVGWGIVGRGSGAFL